MNRKLAAIWTIWGLAWVVGAMAMWPPVAPTPQLPLNVSVGGQTNQPPMIFADGECADRIRALEQEVANCRMTCETWNRLRDHLLVIMAIHPEWVPSDVLNEFPAPPDSLPPFKWNANR